MPANVYIDMDDLYIWLVTYIGEPSDKWVCNLESNSLDYTTGVRYYFEKEDDAVAFRLAWAC